VLTRWSLALLSLLLVPGAALAGASVAAPSHPPLKAVHTTGSIRCDGILDEPSWALATPATELYQQTPDQGAAATLKSEFRVLYDESALYIGARLYDAHPESIQANLGRRDTSLPADRITVYLDPYHDRRSGYLFVVNAAGLRVDGLMYNDGQQDLTWDGVWEGRAHRDSLGWSAELRLPFSQFRFQSEADQTWGIDFKRVIVRRGEESLLAYTPRDGSGFVSRFPDLVGLKGINSSRAIEVTPYSTGKGEFLRHDARDPFNDGSRLDGRTGFDMRAPVGKRLTLNATVNPDFGQVEVDPAVVNLSDVESSFQEKRPYFVEGAANFRFGHEGASSNWSFNWPEPTFFYSRRIGRAPQGSLPGTFDPSRDFSDVPIAATILGAAKLTGKITPTTNFGTLQAVTGKEEAKLDVSGLRSEVEPYTYYQVTRALKEFDKRRAGLGAFSTAVARKFDGGNLDLQLNRSSLFGGLDGWYFLDPKQVWCLNGWLGGSNIQGTTTRLTAVQRSSRHYFQRPDAGDVEVDSAATSLSGMGGRLALNKQSGAVMSNTAIGFLSPGLETNDLGLQSRTDVINGHSVLGYQWTADGKYKRYANVWWALAGSENFDGDVTSATVVHGGNVNWKNNWSGWWNLGYLPRYSDVRSTRGGPKMESRRQGYLDAGFNTDSYKKTFYNGWINLGWDEAGTATNDGGVYVEWKPKSNLFLSAGPWLNVDHTAAQYVATIADPAATETFGNRYVFGELDQTTVGADLRLNWTFTPDLSLETYVQPFLSSGKYRQFKALARPGTYEFAPYAYGGNPNFDVGSLRGNAVLRWEYRPGSALFLVWTQQRDDFEQLGDFDLHRGMTNTLNAPADNVFMLKVSYYLGL
jgi:uncharacterized protein DUF5916/cellulose/xylan binding protein with CBM9 domain